jgi:hypothetical protein
MKEARPEGPVDLHHSGDPWSVAFGGARGSADEVFTKPSGDVAKLRFILPNKSCADIEPVVCNEFFNLQFKCGELWQGECDLPLTA